MNDGNQQPGKRTAQDAFTASSKNLPPATDFGGPLGSSGQKTNAPADAFAWMKDPALGPTDSNGKFKGIF